MKGMLDFVLSIKAVVLPNKLIITRLLYQCDLCYYLNPKGIYPVTNNPLMDPPQIPGWLLLLIGCFRDVFLCIPYHVFFVLNSTFAVGNRHHQIFDK